MVKSKTVAERLILKQFQTVIDSLLLISGLIKTYFILV